ncbi:MAG: HEPN domain-containing protein [Candidatus Rokubacteria bacterium]|nr:HEPN domain-containing protein [Candidatus Rokubacteria bacterium]
MLFLKDDLRIRSASYTLLPALDLDWGDQSIKQLEHIQAIVAYCYIAPHHISGDPFLHFEHSSLVIFSPQPVSIYLVRPEHHVEQVSTGPALTPDSSGHVPGYRGLYNFQHHFWVAAGSRVYPPVPHLSLNISQNLSFDWAQSLAEAPHFHLLPELLTQPLSTTSDRVLTAISWYNRANALASDHATAIVTLAVAFEALLGLPKEAKTDRFTDSISLLLGRISRLDLWAQQFYNARSDILHEGRTKLLRFMPIKTQDATNAPLYHSLLGYGRQIFQLCVGTLLFGAHLGVRAGLPDKLVTNQERFQQICATLDDVTLTIADKFAGIADAVDLAHHYQFVPEAGLRVETMIGAVQRTARALLSCSEPLEPEMKESLEKLAVTPKSLDWYEALDALRALNEVTARITQAPRGPKAITLRLTSLVWRYTFMHYY